MARQKARPCRSDPAGNDQENTERGGCSWLTWSVEPRPTITQATGGAIFPLTCGQGTRYPRDQPIGVEPTGRGITSRSDREPAVGSQWSSDSLAAQTAGARL